VCVGFFVTVITLNVIMAGTDDDVNAEIKDLSRQKRRGHHDDNSTSTPDTCLSAGYQLNNVCNVTESQDELLGALVTFNDLGNVMFLDDIVDDLKVTCTNNSWCLSLNDEERLYRELGEAYRDFCSLADCLMNTMDEGCITDERRLVLSSILVLCSAQSQEASGECLLAIRQMTHVALADLYKEIDGEDDEDSCRDESNDTCEGPCQELAWQLSCMTDICEDIDLSQFSKWQWYYNLRDDMESCQHTNITICESFIQPEVFLIEWDGMYEFLTKKHPQVLVGVTMTTLLIFGGIGALIWFCACRLRRIEYTEVKSSQQENESLMKGEETEEDGLSA